MLPLSDLTSTAIRHTMSKSTNTELWMVSPTQVAVKITAEYVQAASVGRQHQAERSAVHRQQHRMNVSNGEGADSRFGRSICCSDVARNLRIRQNQSVDLDLKCIDVEVAESEPMLNDL